MEINVTSTATSRYLYLWIILLAVGITSLVVVQQYFNITPYLAAAFVLVVGVYIGLSRPALTMSIFIIALPFYPLTIFALEKQLGLTGDQVFFIRGIRDIFVLWMFFWLLFNRAQKTPVLRYRVHIISLWIILLLTYPVLYLFLGSGSIFAALFSIRENLVYLALFFIGRWSILSIHKLKFLVKGIILSGFLISSFGLFQAYVLGPEFLSKFRDVSTIYVSAEGFWGVQRVVGTFAHAIELGLYLVFLCALTLWLLLDNRRKLPSKIIQLGLLGLFLITMGATFSRSAWIGLAVMFVVVFRSRRYLRPLVLIGSLAIILSFFTPVYTYIGRSLSGNDPSFNYHVETLFRSLDFLVKNPFGYGLGQVGVANVRFAEQAVFFEGFYFNLAGELGWVYLMMYFIFLASTFMVLVKIERRMAIPELKKWARIMQGLLASWAVTGFFLPIMTNREIAFTLWFLIGVTINLNQRRSYLPQLVTAERGRRSN